jgi:hypothetical protein
MHVFTAGSEVVDLAVDGETLYVPAGDLVHRVAIAGDTHMVLAALPVTGPIHDIDVRNGPIYAAIGTGDAGEIVSVGADSSGLTTEAAAPFPGRVVTDGARIFWTGSAEGCAAGDGFVKSKLAGQEGVTVVLADSLPCTTRLVERNKFIYWGAGSKIYRAPTEF